MLFNGLHVLKVPFGLQENQKSSFLTYSVELLFSDNSVVFVLYLAAVRWNSFCLFVSFFLFFLLLL